MIFFIYIFSVGRDLKLLKLCSLCYNFLDLNLWIIVDIFVIYVNSLFKFFL